MSEEISVEEVQKENQQLKKELEFVQGQVQEVLDKVQNYLNAQELQKKGLLADMSETIEELRKVFNTKNKLQNN
jgi:hypothetical protein